MGTNIDVTFDPACAATGHAAYFGLGPITGTVQWTGSSCDLGTSGAASFDPGPVPPGDWLYYVIVGHNGPHEGSYGGRPEAVGVGACDRQAGTSTCEPQ